MLKISHYKKGAGLLTCSALLACMTAPALAMPVDFNFVALADGSHGESAYNTLVVTQSGLTVRASATNNHLAYLDASGGSGPAGLGVCKELQNGASTGQRPGLSSNICLDGADDNLGLSETLRLNFSEVVTLNSLTLSNGGHQNVWNGDFGINVLGQPGGFLAFTPSAVTNVGLTGQRFRIRAPATFSGTTGRQSELYISALSATPGTDPVPEPASVALFGTGLLALAGWRAFASRKSSEK